MDVFFLSLWRRNELCKLKYYFEHRFKNQRQTRRLFFRLHRIFLDTHRGLLDHRVDFYVVAPYARRSFHSSYLEHQQRFMQSKEQVKRARGVFKSDDALIASSAFKTRHVRPRRVHLAPIASCAMIILHSLIKLPLR